MTFEAFAPFPSLPGEGRRGGWMDGQLCHPFDSLLRSGHLSQGFWGLFLAHLLAEGVAGCVQQERLPRPC